MVRRMPDRRRLAALAVAAVLGFPAGAAAQGAGDEQYEDPFGGDEPAQEEPQPAATPEPAAPAAPAPGAEPAPPAAEPALAGEQPAELPRTGFDAHLVLLAGALLLAAGIGLRMRLRA